MPTKVTKHTPHMEDHGEDFRLERDAMSQGGKYQWTVYRRTPTGLKLREEHKNHPGQDIGFGSLLYPNEAVEEVGRHPVIRDPQNGEFMKTNLSHVWVPIFKGEEAAARAKLKEHV